MTHHLKTPPADGTVRTHFAHPPALEVTSTGLSDPGQVRSSNKDAFVITEFARTLHGYQTNIPQPESERNTIFRRVRATAGRFV